SLEILGLEFVDVDADQGEGSVFQLRYERPLVGPTGPSGQSDVLPEIEEHDLAAVVAQSEANTVLVRAQDVRRLLADGEVAKREQRHFGVVADFATEGELDVAVLLGGLFEDCLNLGDRPGAVLPPQGVEVVLAIEALVAPVDNRLIL